MKPRIFIVDDEVEIQSLLAMYFSKHGYEVSGASTGTEAVRAANAFPIDLVVMDIKLGEEDGLKVLVTLKSTLPQVKVIMLTGMGFVENLLQEAQAKGADGYVSKLLPLDDLLDAVRHVLKQ